VVVLMSSWLHFDGMNSTLLKLGIAVGDDRGRFVITPQMKLVGSGSM